MQGWYLITNAATGAQLVPSGLPANGVPVLAPPSPPPAANGGIWSVIKLSESIWGAVHMFAVYGDPARNVIDYGTGNPTILAPMAMPHPLTQSWAVYLPDATVPNEVGIRPMQNPALQLLTPTGIGGNVASLNNAGPSANQRWVFTPTAPA